MKAQAAATAATGPPPARSAAGGATTNPRQAQLTRRHDGREIVPSEDENEPRRERPSCRRSRSTEPCRPRRTLRERSAAGSEPTHAYRAVMFRPHARNPCQRNLRGRHGSVGGPLAPRATRAEGSRPLPGLSYPGSAPECSGHKNPCLTSGRPRPDSKLRRARRSYLFIKRVSQIFYIPLISSRSNQADDKTNYGPWSATSSRSAADLSLDVS